MDGRRVYHPPPTPNINKNKHPRGPGFAIYAPAARQLNVLFVVYFWVGPVCPANFGRGGGFTPRRPDQL